MYSSVLPPSVPPPPHLAASPPTTAWAAPSFAITGGGANLPEEGAREACSPLPRGQTITASLSGLNLGSMTPGAWHDPTLPRRGDIELIFDNLRVHIEELFAEQARALAGILAEVQQQRALQELWSHSSKLSVPVARQQQQQQHVSHGGAELGVCSAPPTMFQSLSLPGCLVPDSDGDDSPSSKPQGRSVGHVHEHRDSESWVDGEGFLGYYYRRFSEVIESTTFDYIMGAVIVLNTIFLGIQVDIKVRGLVAIEDSGDAEPFYFKVVETAFAMIFAVEVLARLAAARWRYVKSAWNWLDVFVVASALLEECLKYGIGGDTIAGKLSVFRILRVSKLLRTLRIIRVVRAFRELRIVLASIMRSIRALFWTICLFFVFIYFLSVLILVELTSSDFSYDGDDTLARLRRQYFSSLARSLVTVYQCCTGGVLWESASTSLEAVIPWITALWVLFVGFVFFAISNVVTGIFVDQAMKSAHDDMQNVEIEEFDRQEGVAKAMRTLILESVSGTRNGVDRQTMLRLFKDRGVVAMLQRVDISPRDVCSLFDIVVGERRSLPLRDVDAFVRACFRLKGYARSIDIAAVFFQQKRLVSSR